MMASSEHKAMSRITTTNLQLSHPSRDAISYPRQWQGLRRFRYADSVDGVGGKIQYYANACYV